jgi:predicted PurR-regulated permease PerM
MQWLEHSVVRSVHWRKERILVLHPAAKRARHGKREITEAQFDRMLGITSRLAMLLIGAIVIIAAMKYAHAVLLPVGLAFVVGLVFGPIADWLEQRGMPPAASAGLVVLCFLVLIVASVAAFALPLTEWVGRAPAIWAKLQAELGSWKQPFEMLSGVQEQIRTALGGSETAVEVTVEQGNQVFDLALSIPLIVGDILIFLVSLFFYLATREQIRISILSLIVTRRMRWRAAHVFSDVEAKVSRFLIAVTILNLIVGVVMTLVTWWVGLPSPLLWGAFAAVLNYIPFVGQAVMIGILLLVGLATQPDLPLVLAPIGIYLLLNFFEGQIAFPTVVGRSVTINPFLIFLSIIFWIFVWGPVGALMAVPSLIVLQSVISHILPSKDVKPRRPVRRTPDMSAKDVVLANAAKAIREQAADEDAAKAEAKTKTGTNSPAPAR